MSEFETNRALPFFILDYAIDVSITHTGRAQIGRGFQ